MNQKRILIILCMMILSAFTIGILAGNASPLKQDGGQIELAEKPADSETDAATEETPTEEEKINEETENTAEEPEEPQDPPEAPVPENPKGSFRSRAMGFYWKPSLNAAYYEINWQNDRGYSETLQMENDDWTCQMDRCILYTELPSDGNYTWTMTAVNVAGNAVSEEMTFNIPSLIATPDAYRPNSSLSNQKPLIFEWEDTGSGASAYRIQAADVETDQIRMDVHYSADAVRHMNGVCYLETEDYLSSGFYVWRVQVVNGTDFSGWSSWKAFSVNCPECSLGTYLNTTTKTIFPNGAISGTSPEFVWQAITGAQNYQLEIKNSKETILLNESVPASNCGVEICAFVPDLTLETGDSYTWTITAYGWNNSYWGEASGAYSVISSDIDMQDIQFIGPAGSGSLDPDNQQIIWSDPGPSTVSFRLGIRSSQGEWLLVSDLTRDDAWCDGITCSIQFHTIPEGEDYEIVIIPYSEFNIPGNSVSLSFSSQTEAEKE